VNTQEYELAFVTELPAGVTAVDAHTLDFAKNPAGALAFRYKHGWILINPLVPSRGLSGGGLARQHGHLSGGHTTGHFLKGADGKIQFKAVNRYASREDWEKDVKKSAEAASAAQGKTKVAVQAAESATAKADKVAESGAPSAAQAEAHKLAAAAHEAAAKAFQGAGTGKVHRSGAMTHSAYGAIHDAKAKNLAEQAKQEAAAKVEKRKAAAEQLTTKANELAAKAKQGSNDGKSYQELHKLHLNASDMHAAAQKANLLAGNEFTAKAHGVASDKHGKIAENHLTKHKSLEDAAETTGQAAAKATFATADAKKQDLPLKDQIAAHQAAAKAHGWASTAKGNIGNTTGAHGHKVIQGHHEAQAAELKQKQADQAAAKVTSENAAKASAQATQAGKDNLPLPDQIAAHQAAHQAHGEAATAYGHLGDAHEADFHQFGQGFHAKKITALTQQHAELETAKAEAAALSKDALTKTEMVGSAKTPQEKIAAHEIAADANTKAAEAKDAAGLTADADKHLAWAGMHKQDAQDLKTEQIKAAVTAAEEHSNAKHMAALEATAAADKAGATQGGISKHLDAATAHTDAADAAKKAGTPGLAAEHVSKAKFHLEDAADIKQKLNAANAKAGDAYNKADDAEFVGSTDQAVHHFKQAVKFAEEADNLSLKAKAAHHLAELSGKKADHQAAGLAAVKMLSQKDLAEPHKAQYADWIKQHGDAVEAIGQKEANSVPVPPAEVTPKVSTAPKAAGEPNEVTTGQIGGKYAGYVDGKQVTGLYADPDAAKAQAHSWLSAQGKKAAAGSAEPKASEKVLKPVGKLTGTGKKLGSHNNEVMTDEAGNQWLSKKDSEGYSRALDPAVAALHRKVGLDTPVFVKTKDGHLQGMVPGATDAFPNGQFNPEKLSQDDITKMLQHQVLDYATGNQDTHTGQWLQTPGGLQQIDQGQAFKYGVGAEPGGGGKGDPTATYTPLAPNSPVYPKLWNAAKAGKIHIPDPSGDNDFAKTIKSLQDMPDDQFKALFTPYAKQAIEVNGKSLGGHSTVDGFLDSVVAHKKTLGSDFQKLYDQLPAAAKAPATSAGPTAEVDSPHVSDTAAATPFLSPKEWALKALAEHESGDSLDWDHEKMKALKKAAKDAGASVGEVQAAFHKPEEYLDKLKSKPAIPAPASSGLSSKDAALKTLAEYEHTTPYADWSESKQDELKQAAQDAGASPDEVAKAHLYPGQFLDDLAAKKPATAAPAAKAAPTVDPFKPKAKWSKATHKVTVGGVTEDVAALQGPKGLHVHKAVGDTKGWVVSTKDGLSVGPVMKTQKEAKLAAEWISKNHGSAGHITADSHKKWQAEYPDAMAKFKNGVGNEQWNKDAQAEVDKATAVSSPASAASVTPSVPAAPAAPAPMVEFTGLGGDKKANAALMKQLYDQAHGPNATAAMKAEYEKAQAAWADKHSTGPFDPTKYVAPPAPPAPGTVANPQAGKAIHKIKAGGNPHFTPDNPTGSKPEQYKNSDPLVIAANTKEAFPSSYEAGYRMVPLTESANGDWKPDVADKGPGTGAYWFSTNDYSRINQQLRGSLKKGIGPVGPVGGKWDDVIAHADQIFDKVPPSTEPIVTIRRMNDSGQFPVPPPPLEAGSVFVDEGFGSTSKSPGNWSGDVHLEVRIPKGAKFLDLNHTVGSEYPTEMELLLPRKTRYKVVSDSWSNGGSKTGTRKLVVEIVV
jgi:colicin import membrane protein